MICNNCGFEFENGNFCPNCGSNAQINQSNDLPFNNPQIVMSNVRAINPPLYGFGIASMIAGIFSVFLSFFCIYGSLPQLFWGVLALVFSLIAKSAAKKVNVKNKFANAGLVLSIIGISIAILYAIFFVLYVLIVASSSVLLNN